MCTQLHHKGVFRTMRFQGHSVFSVVLPDKERVYRWTEIAAILGHKNSSEANNLPINPSIPSAWTITWAEIERLLSSVGNNVHHTVKKDFTAQTKFLYLPAVIVLIHTSWMHTRMDFCKWLMKNHPAEASSNPEPDRVPDNYLLLYSLDFITDQTVFYLKRCTEYELDTMLHEYSAYEVTKIIDRNPLRTDEYIQKMILSKRDCWYKCGANLYLSPYSSESQHRFLETVTLLCDFAPAFLEFVVDVVNYTGDQDLRSYHLNGTSLQIEDEILDDGVYGF